MSYNNDSDIAQESRRFPVINMGVKYRQSNLFYSCLFKRSFSCGYTKWFFTRFDEMRNFFLARHILWIWLIVHLCCWFFYINNRWSHVGIEENCHYLLIFIFSNRDKIQFFRQKWNHGVQNWITELFVWRNEMFNSFLVLGFKILLCGELCNGKLISRDLCMYLIH